MAKHSKKHHAVAHHAKRHNPSVRRHHRRSYNPFGLDLPLGGKALLPALLGAPTGGIAASYLTNLLLGASDVGWKGYAGNAAVAVVGSALLKKIAPNFALGFLLGGGTVVIGRIVDDVLNKPIITVQAASSPLAAFYKRGFYSLPAPWGAGAPPYQPPALPAKSLHGLGWSPMRSRLAA
jgi:hypothetical protein